MVFNGYCGLLQERKSCPNCNVAVKKADIRPLFSDHVAVVDNSGVESMKQMYEDERSKRIQVSLFLVSCTDGDYS